MKKKPPAVSRARKSRAPKVFTDGAISVATRLVSKKRKNLRNDVACKTKNNKTNDVPKIRGDFDAR